MGKSYNGSIGAIDALTGQKAIWRFGTPGNFYAAPIIANGLIYDVQGNPGNPTSNLFEVRDLTTGNVLFSRAFNSPIKASPTVLNGIVYIATFNRVLYALKPTA